MYSNGCLIDNIRDRPFNADLSTVAFLYASLLEVIDGVLRWLLPDRKCLKLQNKPWQSFETHLGFSASLSAREP